MLSSSSNDHQPPTIMSLGLFFKKLEMIFYMFLGRRTLDTTTMTYVCARRAATPLGDLRCCLSFLRSQGLLGTSPLTFYDPRRKTTTLCLVDEC